MKIYSKIVIRKKFIYEDESFQCSASEMMEILEELEETQAGFVVLVINNNDLGKYLESKDVAVRGTRGSYYRGENFDSFNKDFSKIYYSTSLV